MSSLIFNEDRRMNMKEGLKFAFPKTVPIMAGYLFLGASFGILAVSQGLSPLITALMSLLILDRKSTRLNSSHVAISYAVFCLKKKKNNKKNILKIKY